jgi:hypothetical protein
VVGERDRPCHARPHVWQHCHAEAYVFAAVLLLGIPQLEHLVCAKCVCVCKHGSDLGTFAGVYYVEA